MGAYEAIDKLCAVTTMLSDLATARKAVQPRREAAIQYRES